MDPARIAKLLEPFLDQRNDQRLTTKDLNYISTYIDILRRWNSRINLTAIRDPEEIVTRHFGESLFAARHLFPRDAHPTNGGESTTSGRLEVADIGSGAGFPGLVLRLWAPDIALTLIESNHKKATFLREVTRALTLTDVNIQNVRAETLPGQSFDLVTLRAVEHFEDILPIAANLVKPTGRLALMISAAQLSQARTTLLRHIWTEPIPIPSSRSRILVESRQPNLPTDEPQQ